jgi:hypothetical protein
MNACRKTQALLFESADGQATLAVQAELEAHLGSCASCQQVFSTWTAALPRLRGLAPDELSVVSLRRMENLVLQQVPRKNAPARAWHLSRLAIAAGVALLVGATLWQVLSTRPQPFARIQTTWGRVTLSGVALTKGVVMGPGGVLEIAAEGEAAFQVGRSSEVQLVGPGRVVFAGSAAAPRLHLHSGRLAVQIAHRRAEETFTVLTTQGRVEVRGTRFVVGYGAAGSYVHVDEGQVMAFRQGAGAAVAVQAGETFPLSAEAPTKLEPPPVALPLVQPPTCSKAACDDVGGRARAAMRVGRPERAIEMVDHALANVAECVPVARCLDELGYLRAEALRQAGSLDAAVRAYKALNNTGTTRAMRQNALYAAAEIERRLGRSADARQSLERAWAAHPDGALAEESLSALLDVLESGSDELRSAAESYLRRYPRGMAAARARRILSGASHSP